MDKVITMVFAFFSGVAAAYAGGAHEFSFEGVTGGAVRLGDYAAGPILVVNTASECGYTPQYEGLQAIWEAYRDRGLTVVGVPSNDFGGQEPLEAKEIKDFCEINYGVDFPLAAKTAVTGADAHAFFRWAEGELGAEARPQWNFHKYLVGADGSLLAAFPSRVRPQDDVLVTAIEAALKKAE